MADAAKQLVIHPDSLWLLLKAGSVRGVRFGRYWRVPLVEIDRCKREGLPSLKQSRDR